ncbi:Uu.00g147120.m01.CDS01 [Anthostomella pinea]|uniref:Uu.00g147120.m01.CDS01 n=1 Tax=Anthostomella pinea TaxID=933095 RepID=A0AAI8VRB3_9PEZI|nr:Uu.00g147120.m01.CDS01 [Anthostomella pinea]
MASPQSQDKREGNISDSFVSLSGKGGPPLPERFLELKKTLISGHEDRVIASWQRLLAQLSRENETVAKEGPQIVPSLEFKDLEGDLTRLRGELRKRGVAVIRGVIPEDEARAFKGEIEEYVRQNPSTKAYPEGNPQVYELYWSGPQTRSRAHPNLLKVQTALMELWHSSDPESAISTSQPLAYADRLRIRQPGDATFALGPHIDGGSVERWELHGYGLGGVYNKIFKGSWEEFDPWDASTRVSAVMDNYNGLGACSMLRMFQGWLSMSHTKPLEGTLMVNPLLQLSVAYLLLRPFFRPINEAKDTQGDEYLAAENWLFAGTEMTSELQGATPGYGQELNAELHPHLELDKTMIHMPQVKPGDFVVWHCDTIHAVDKVHKGKMDSSVLYIPICPVTESNAKYLLRQKNAFLNGIPGPDFPGGQGEANHVNRPTEEYLRSCAGANGLRAFGFEKLVAADTDGPGARAIAAKANEILGL